jgi:hypothetical protein
MKDLAFGDSNLGGFERAGVLSLLDRGKMTGMRLEWAKMGTLTKVG